MWKSYPSRSQACGLFVLLFVIGLDLLAAFSLAVPTSVSANETYGLQARSDPLGKRQDEDATEVARKIRKSSTYKKQLNEGKVPIGGVDSLLLKLQAAGYAERLPNIFYTGKEDFPLMKEWAQVKFKEMTDSCIDPEDNTDNWGFVMWYRLLGFVRIQGQDDLEWVIDSQLLAEVRRNMRKVVLGDSFTYANIVRGWWTEVFQKNLAQAYAEASHGVVYVVMEPKMNVKNELDLWGQTSAWGGESYVHARVISNECANVFFTGWELPALTRNEKVKEIVRVTLSRDKNGDINSAEKVIWTRGATPKDTPKTKVEPKGIRKDMVTNMEFMIKRSKASLFERWPWYPLETVIDRIRNPR